MHGRCFGRLLQPLWWVILQPTRKLFSANLTKIMSNGSLILRSGEVTSSSIGFILQRMNLCGYYIMRNLFGLQRYQYCKMHVTRLSLPSSITFGLQQEFATIKKFKAHLVLIYILSNCTCMDVEHSNLNAKSSTVEMICNLSSTFVTGAIELAILSDYYGREIAAYDIQTTRCDLYGQVIFLLLLDVASLSSFSLWAYSDRMLFLDLTP